MKGKLPSHLFAVLALGFVSQVGQVLLLRELLMAFCGDRLLSIANSLHGADAVWPARPNSSSEVLRFRQSRPF